MCKDYFDMLISDIPCQGKGEQQCLGCRLRVVHHEPL